MRILGLIALIFATLSGCERPIPNPETLDPIFSELNKSKSDALTAAEAEKARIQELKTQRENLPARDPMRKRLMREIYDRERALTYHEQKALYFEIRAEQRKQFGRSEYLNAFNEGQKWPDPKEFQAFKRIQELDRASRNWSDRVPTLSRHKKPHPELDKVTKKDK